MPPITAHQSSTTTKLLLIGDSGGGKTGALASLAQAGYNLRIIDLDNGVDILKNLLTDPASPYKVKDLASQVQYITVTDPMKKAAVKTADGNLAANATLVPAVAKAWPKVISLLTDWTDGDIKLGSILTWTPQDILVIDSLSRLSDAAKNFILGMNGRLGQPPFQSDWGDAQRLVEGLLAMLYDEHVTCNVIVTAHITYIGNDNEPVRGYPNSLGVKLPPKIATYFNSTLMCRGGKKILTNTQGLVDLKNTNPYKVKKEYPIETGLAEYFAAVRGTSTPTPPTPPGAKP